MKKTLSLLTAFLLALSLAAGALGEAAMPATDSADAPVCQAPAVASSPSDALPEEAVESGLPAVTPDEDEEALTLQDSEQPLETSAHDEEALSDLDSEPSETVPGEQEALPAETSHDNQELQADDQPDVPAPEAAESELPEKTPDEDEKALPIQDSEPSETMPGEQEALPAETSHDNQELQADGQPDAPAPEAAESELPEKTPDEGEEALPDPDSEPSETVSEEQEALPAETPDEDEEAQDVSSQEEQLPLSVLIDQQHPDRSIKLFAHLGGKTELALGDPIVFSAELHGYEGLIYQLTWQYSAGGEWQDIQHAHGLEYTLVLSEQTALWSLRVVVDITGMQGQP